jgi:hypothetical protein
MVLVRNGFTLSPERSVCIAKSTLSITHETGSRAIEAARGRAGCGIEVIHLKYEHSATK